MTAVDTSKLQEAVHFVTRTMANDPDKLGAVKLQKILWYFDARAFFFTGRTATGATYVKKDHGPYSYDIPRAVADLVTARRLHTDKDPTFYGLEKSRFIGKGETKKSVFSDKELRWLREITEDVCENHTASSISEKTRGPVWKMAQDGKEIPFAAVGVRFRAPSQETMERLKREFA